MDIMYWPEPDGSAVTVWAEMPSGNRTHIQLSARELRINPEAIEDVAREFTARAAWETNALVEAQLIRSPNPPYPDRPPSSRPRGSWLRRFGRWLGLVRD